MDYRKLFHVLVVGGALVGGVAGCGGDSKTETPPAQNNDGSGDAGTPDGGTTGNTGNEGDSGSTDPDPGGGVSGW